MNDLKVATERFSTLDTYKGLLIIILVAHHIPFIALDCMQLNNDLWANFEFMREYLYGPFFMTAFFVATGISSNFEKPFSSFVRKLTLICIPGFLLVPGHWYVYAFVLAKLGYYSINKLKIVGGGNNDIVLLVLSLLLAFVAVMLFHKIPEFRFVYHAVLMIPFIHIGYWFKKRLFSSWTIIIVATVLYVVGSTLYYLNNWTMSMFEFEFRINILSFIPFVVFAITGSLMMIGISKLMNCKLFQSLGRQSLVIFMVHHFFLSRLLKICTPLINESNGNSNISVLIFVSILVVTLVICMIVARILNTKYLRWVLGK